MEDKARVYDIEALLAQTETWEAKDVLPTIIEAICSREGRKLFGRELDLYFLNLVHAGIFLDGINGTLFNYGLSVLAFTAKALERIGATERARILKQAVDTFGNEEQRRELAKNASWDVTPEQEKLFNELDSRYYKRLEDVRELMIAYIRQHIEDFRSYETRH